MTEQNTNPPLEDDGPQGELPMLDPSQVEAEPEVEVPISLVDEGDVPAHDVKAFGVKKIIGGKKEPFGRKPTMTGQGAVRCRVFHSRVAPNPLAYMEEQINDWLDKNEIEVKAVNQVIGVMEGKTPEPNVIITVWY